uniref:Uncharacterized protein n=1 Tax=Lepeophtheirus salmonis TaxID=72036 RepID=A0A0K2SXQ2_LEPSM
MWTVIFYLYKLYSTVRTLESNCTLINILNKGKRVEIIPFNVPPITNQCSHTHTCICMYINAALLNSHSFTSEHTPRMSNSLVSYHQQTLLVTYVFHLAGSDCS